MVFIMTSKFNLNRRDFLKLAGLGGLVLAGIDQLSKYVYSQNQVFFDLVKNSIEQGKALTDVSEILQSRFAPDNDIYPLGNEIFSHDEDWMHQVADHWNIHRVEEIDSQIIFLDITNTCGVTSPKLGKMDDIYRDNPNFEGLDPVTAYTCDFEAAMAEHPFMTLPVPQFVYGEEYIFATTGEKDILVDYDLYQLYAKFRKDGQGDTSATIRAQPSGKRGGLILTSQGTLIVTTPDEFNAFDFEADNLKAQMEYAFIIDSNSVEEDLSTIESSTGLKIITAIDSYPNWITTFYDEKGNITTVSASNICLYDKSSDSFGTGPKNLTIPQFINLTNEYAIKHGYKRFVTAIPDTASRNELITPFSLTNTQVQERYPSNYGWDTSPISTALHGSNFPAYRILDSSTCTFTAFPRRYPHMITASKF